MDISGITPNRCWQIILISLSLCHYATMPRQFLASWPGLPVLRSTKPPQPCPFCFWGALELSQCVYGLRLKALPRLVEASVNSAICTRASEKTVKVNNGCKWTSPPISLVLFHRTLEHLPYLFGWWGKELNGRTLRMSKSLASTLDGPTLSKAKHG